MRTLVAFVMATSVLLAGVALWPVSQLLGGVENLEELPAAWKDALEREQWDELFRLLHPDDRPTLLASMVFEEPRDRNARAIPGVAATYAAIRARHGVRWSVAQWDARPAAGDPVSARVAASDAVGPVRDPAALFAEVFGEFVHHQPGYLSVLPRASAAIDSTELRRLGDDEARMPEGDGVGVNWYGRVQDRWFVRLLSGVAVWSAAEPPTRAR